MKPTPLLPRFLVIQPPLETTRNMKSLGPMGMNTSITQPVFFGMFFVAAQFETAADFFSERTMRNPLWGAVGQAPGVERSVFWGYVSMFPP